MTINMIISDLAVWTFGTFVFAVGVLVLILVHAVPGVLYLLLSSIYFPPVNMAIRKRFGFVIPVAVKIVLGIIIIIFTFGVSDLGDMIDKL
jgi:hypothetical protein